MSVKPKWKVFVTILATVTYLLQYMTAFAGSVTYDYDDLNRLTKARYNDGTVILYSYDEVGNRTQEQTYSTVSAPYNITVNTSGCGTVTPSSGVVMVQSGSSQTVSFQSSPGNSLVDVIVDGTSVGIVPSYTFYNISGNHTLSVRFIVPDGDVNLDGVVNQSDSELAMDIAMGTVTATPLMLARGDVAPLVNGAPSPNGIIDSGDVLIIMRKYMGLASWPASCEPIQSENLPVRIANNPSVYFRSLQSAYNTATTGTTVQAISAVFIENANFNRNISIFLDGGYGNDYAANPNFTTINGAMTITNGTVIVRNIVVR